MMDIAFQMMNLRAGNAPATAFRSRSALPRVFPALSGVFPEAHRCLHRADEPQGGPARHAAAADTAVPDAPARSVDGLRGARGE